jgi:orotidine-5'-phosphate decarboxylase
LAQDPAAPADKAAGSFHFADALVTRIRELRHPLCVGLDPHLSQIPPLFRRGAMQPGSPETARAVGDFLTAVVDRLEGRTAIVKPQIAFFEQLGSAGIVVLEAVLAQARSRGLLVLLDAKRGDIGSTAAAYARAYLDPRSSLASEALTVNPYLGLDTLEPFTKLAREHGRGVFVLVRTSNPGAGSLQDLEVERRATSGRDGGSPLFQEVARSLTPLAAELRGSRTGWSSLGVVVGATWPEQARAVREALPESLFLVPGFGAQGGSPAEAVSGFVPGPNGLEGGLVSSSRGVLFPDGASTEDASVWEAAIDRALDRATSELGEAVSR